LAKQQYLPIALAAEAAAEVKLVQENVDLDNYLFHLECNKSFFNKLITDNISNYAADDDNAHVDLEKFVAWAYAKQVSLPQEFLVLINKADTRILLRDSQVDKLVVQGIAQTLWSIYPEKTQEDIANSRQVKVFGAGKDYDVKTLKRWISECDMRTKKTGPKSK
jgi:hypothetical protein